MAILWKKKTRQYFLENMDHADGKIEVTVPHILLKIKMIDLTIEDLQIINQMQGLIKENIDRLVSDFYKTILQVEELKKIIEKHSSVERLRSTLKTHLIELFDGKIDTDFIEKRLKVAKIHYYIGLKPAYYMGAFQNLQKTLFDIIFENVPDRMEIKTILTAVTKIFSLEQQIVLESYEQERANVREQEHQQVRNEIKNKIIEVSTDLVATVEQTSASVGSLLDSSKKVNELVTHTENQSLLTEEFVTEGQKEITHLVGQIQSINNDIENMNEMVKNLLSSSQQIKDVINIVQAIADQTNLLALNSAIEAARAGEHGKGFAVVADEVRKLAVRTKESIGTIEELISLSNTYTNQVDTALRNVNVAVVEGRSKSAKTSEAFDQITTSMKNSVKQVSDVKVQINHIVETIHEFGQAMSTVSSSAENLNNTANLA
ncbi:globin-coupled sensor protein [Cytobacillus dafuensis]|uniref:Globin-coupled sensor protein n=1 Tax=Cytobacillus dafuensis TaxID=1742359 RepID=A0A5B8Z087_CYTDA|nr:globin-coupled sensor protein [Cytobacillus dafuensis]QED46161.1 globin-coupled sensor protein [Cytobacillus dafuensis]